MRRRCFNYFFPGTAWWFVTGPFRAWRSLFRLLCWMSIWGFINWLVIWSFNGWRNWCAFFLCRLAQYKITVLGSPFLCHLLLFFRLTSPTQSLFRTTTDYLLTSFLVYIKLTLLHLIDYHISFLSLFFKLLRSHRRFKLRFFKWLFILTLFFFFFLFSDTFLLGFSIYGIKYFHSVF